MKQIAKSGRKILFVATKKQAKDIVSEKVKAINMPYVTERWPGGMLTNFPTIRKAVKKMSAIDKMATDGTFDTLSKRERLQITRQRAKLEKNLGSYFRSDQASCCHVYCGCSQRIYCSSRSQQAEHSCIRYGRYQF